MLPKQEVRTRMFAARRAIEPAELELLDAAVARHALAAVQEAGATSVTAYIGLPGEPGGTVLTTTLADAGITVWLPISQPHGALLWGRYTGLENLVPGAYRIPEPTGERVDVPPVDLILAPALGITPDGYRLGKGGGYYDRLLERLAVPSLGLVYANEVRADLPLEDHDRPVSGIVSDAGVTWISR